MHKIKVNDLVMVVAGKDKGKTGKVSKIDRKNSKVVVAGVNVVKKAIKPTKENPAGGITEKNAAIDISNVSLLSPKSNKPTRVRFESRDGKKVRISVACKSVI